MSKQIEFIARGLAFRGSTILACRSDSGGYFYLPGGHVEFMESAAAALQREFSEECGAELQVQDPVIWAEVMFSSGGRRHHELNVVFHVELDPHLSIGSREPGISFHWLEVAALADVDFRPGSLRAWLMSGGPKETAWISQAAS